MIFRQLFDAESFTFSYLLADRASGDAVIIDSVREQAPRDLQLLRELGLRLRFAMETHVHADHVTGAAVLRKETGAEIVISRDSGVRCADRLLDDRDELVLGSLRIQALSTPGHTRGCMSYLCRGMLFSGDTLFVRDVGRTDFQEGSAEKMFHSIVDRLFKLPGDTLLFPGHDYRGFTVSTIGEEVACNPRIGGGVQFPEFSRRMAALQLAPPKKIHVAVPANLRCGAD